MYQTTETQQMHHTNLTGSWFREVARIAIIDILDTTRVIRWRKQWHPTPVWAASCSPALLLPQASSLSTCSCAHIDLASQGQPKGNAEIPVVTRESRRNSRKTMWFPPLGKMRPLPATASQGKSPVPP